MACELEEAVIVPFVLMINTERKLIAARQTKNSRNHFVVITGAKVGGENLNRNSVWGRWGEVLGK